MKILWFTNTPCSATEILYPNLNRGGWLSSLEKEISNIEEIELHIGFYLNVEKKPFIHNNNHFYPIYRKYSGNRIKRYFGRLISKKNTNKNEINNIEAIVNYVQPDIIHIHGTEENFGIIQNHCNIPVVISIQGILSPIVEKFFTGIPLEIINKYSSFKNKIFLKTAKDSFTNINKRSIREKNILSNCKFIIGRTEFDQRVTRILAPNSKYFKLQEILRTPFYINKWEKDNFQNKIQIASILSDENYKGYETILKTAKILSHYPNYEFNWSIAGIDIRSNIYTISEKWLKLKSENYGIKILGNYNAEDIVNLLKSSDIFCQLSHIENSPNSLCEAMILGVPSIATFVGGTSSILENGKEGYLVQEGDPYAFAGAIVELTNNFEKAKYFSNHARVKALKRHDKKVIVLDLISIYQSILN